MIRLGLGEGAALLAMAVVGAWFDQSRSRLPHWLLAVGVVLGAAVNFRAFGVPGLVNAVLGLALAGLVYAVPWRLGIVKPDDVKLAATLGAIAGPFNWLLIFLFAVLVGIPLAVLMTLLSAKHREAGVHRGRLVREMVRFLPPYTKADELTLHGRRVAVLSHGLVMTVGVALFLLVAVLTWAPK